MVLIEGSWGLSLVSISPDAVTFKAIIPGLVAMEVLSLLINLVFQLIDLHSSDGCDEEELFHFNLYYNFYQNE